MEITVETIKYLVERPELFASRPFKELRAAIHPLVELQMKKYDPIDYMARVTVALRGDSTVPPWR